MANWDWDRLLIFGLIFCVISLLFSVVGSISPQIILIVPARGGLSVSSNTILLLLGSFLPGIVLLLGSRECRSATLRLKASPGVYVSAVLIGFLLPFSSYLGARVSYLLGIRPPSQI